MALRFAHGIFFFYVLLLMFNHGTGARVVAEQELGSNYISSYGHKHDAEKSGYKAAYNTQEDEKDSQYEAAYGTKKEYAAAYNTQEGEKDSQYEAAYGTKKEYAAAYNTQEGEKDSQYEAAYGTKKEYAAAYNTQEGEKDSQYEAAYGTKKEYAAAYNTREGEKDSQHEAASCFWLSSCFTKKSYAGAYNTGKGKKYEAAYGTKQRYATAYGSKQGYTAAYGTKQDPKSILHRKDANGMKSRNSHMDHSEAFKVGLFTMDDLYVGRTMAVNFPIEEFPNFLPRKEADSIPFSTPEIPNVLQLFSIPTGSPDAKSMGFTLQQCEAPPITGEIKFCATSLESMLDFVSTIMGSLTNLNLVTTTHPTMSTALTQNYTVLRFSKEFFAPKWVVCHPLPFPYKVFYCHFQENTKIFKVSLGGENGQNVESAAVCHMDTSEWNPDHMIFRQLGVKPGSTPVCHFLPIYHLVWVPSTTGASI